MPTNQISSAPYWTTTATFSQFAKLAEDLMTDVVVIGAGITGLTTAYLLAKAGKRVVVLERDRCAMTDTGHTSAHLTMVTDTGISDLVKVFGRNHARLLREVLETLHLPSWVKTTGGRGLHVVVPLQPNRSISECLDFSRDVSEAMAHADPRSYTTQFAKAGRQRQIPIDYLRNNRTNTSVSAFSPRARPEAVVSTPLDWSELGEAPERWTLLTVPRRLDRLGADPWRDYWRSPQALQAASIAAVARLPSG